MAVLPPDIRPRVGQFARLLASGHDHEVLAAVRALRRTLSGAGCDFNDLGDTIEREPADTTRPRSGFPIATAGPAWSPLSRFSVVGFLTRHIQHQCLTSWEADFIASIVNDLQSPHRYLSDRQAETLNHIIRKIAGAQP